MARMYGSSRLFGLPMFLALMLQHTPSASQAPIPYGVPFVRMFSAGPIGGAAREGDPIVASFDSSEATASATATFGTAPSAHTVACTPADPGATTRWRCDLVLPAGMPDGALPVEVSATSVGGVTVVVTGSGMVLVDNTPPTFSSITLSPAVLSRAGDYATLNFEAQEDVWCDKMKGIINGKTATCTYVAQFNRRKCRCITGGLVASDPAVASIPISLVVTDMVGNFEVITATTGGSATEVRRIASLITVTSDGPAPSRGKVYPVVSGNVVTLSIATSEAPDAPPSATLGGQAAACTATPDAENSYTCTRAITASDPVGPLAVSVMLNGFAYDATTDGTGATRLEDNSAPADAIVRIVSNNPTPTHAKSSNTVTVSFTGFPGASTTTLAAQIMSIVARCVMDRAQAGVVLCSARVTSRTTNGPAAFSITSTDGSGFKIVSPTDGSSVLVDTAAPTLQTVSIASSGRVESEAAPGDTVNLQLVGSEELASSPVVMFGSLAAPCVRTSPINFKCSAKLPSNARPGTIRFTVKATDMAGNIVQARATTDGSKVTVVRA